MEARDQRVAGPSIEEEGCLMLGSEMALPKVPAICLGPPSRSQRAAAPETVAGMATRYCRSAYLGG
jgi:hypothetical protein